MYKMVFYMLFFFWKNTSYEVRISDRSTDVCSSDLGDFGADGGRRDRRWAGRGGAGGGDRAAGRCGDLCAQGARGAAAGRPEGAGVDLWPADSAAVRDDARRGQRDLGDRPDRAADEKRRRQGAAVGDRI